MRIYFQALKIYYQALKIYYQALIIILHGVAGCFLRGINLFFFRVWGCFSASSRF